MRRLAAVAAVAALAAGAACTAPRPASPRSVLLVTIDTLRADRVGRGIAPALDALASGGLHFTNARTTAPLTLPAHATILTGLPPTAHGVHDNGVVLAAGTPTLATVLRGAGFRTAAFVGAYVLDRRFGLGAGFEVYDDRIARDAAADARLEAERPARVVVDAALAWLERAGPEPFFLWVHLYDPHAPYAPPADAPAIAGRSGYDGEVAYASSQMARLLEALDRLGRRDATIVTVAGDHGEGLGEHGEQTHGMLAYDATLRVPLVLAVPGQAPQTVDHGVSLADLAPSLLRFSGASATLTPAAMARDLTTPGGQVYAETEYPRAAGWHPLHVLVDGPWKLILAATPRLFDVSTDPGERADVAAAQRQRVAAMTARLRALQAAAAAPAGRPAGGDTDARLRALGYVSSAPAHETATAADPDAEIAHWTTFERALGQVTAGDAAGATPALRDLSARYPTATVFQSTYARALQESGQPGAAVAVLRAAVARRPDATLFHDLAVAAALAGDAGEARRAEEAALALDPMSAAAMNGLGLLHAEANRAADAAPLFDRAAALDPTNASIWANLGNARQALGDLPGAEAAYRRGLEAQPQHLDAANGLGVVLVQRGRPADAVPVLERVVAAAPDFHEARLNLGIALQQSGASARAAAVYRDLLARAPARFARERQAATTLLRGLR